MMKNKKFEIIEYHNQHLLLGRVVQNIGERYFMKIINPMEKVLKFSKVGIQFTKVGLAMVPVIVLGELYPLKVKYIKECFKKIRCMA